MTIHTGPILRFCGARDGQWRVSAIIVADQSPGKMRVRTPREQIEIAPDRLTNLGKLTVYRYRWQSPQTDRDTIVAYSLSRSLRWSYIVPARNAIPRMACVSCNGLSDAATARQMRERQDERWQHMARVNRQRDGQMHLLVMGGDQIYADPLWDRVEPLREWLELSDSRRKRAPFTDAMRRDVESFYFHFYVERFGRTDPGKMFAAACTIMMWDDHDIFDGWGSGDAAMQRCPVYQGIFKIARRYFEIFQLQQKPDEIADDRIGTKSYRSEPIFNLGYRFGDAAMLTLDLRSLRTPDRVMPDSVFSSVFDWMETLNDIKHLMVMTSIPVMYPTFMALEEILRWVPGRQDLEDDLHDHWTSVPHRQQRLRLIHRLLRFAGERRCRVTILSGDGHVAAVGTIESDRIAAPAHAQVITNLISSAVVNQPPKRIGQFFLKVAADRVEKIDRGIIGKMSDFPATHLKFLAKRNWMSLIPDEAHRLWATWHVEDDPNEYCKVIHPVANETSQ